MREHSIVTFLRLVSLLDGRSPKQLQRLIGMPRATFNRYLQIARRCGIVVTYCRRTEQYSVVDAGPFNLLRLRQSRLSVSRGTLVSMARAA